MKSVMKLLSNDRNIIYILMIIILSTTHINLMSYRISKQFLMRHPNLSSFVGRPSLFTIVLVGKVAVISAHNWLLKIKKK